MIVLADSEIRPKRIRYGEHALAGNDLKAAKNVAGVAVGATTGSAGVAAGLGMGALVGTPGGPVGMVAGAGVGGVIMGVMGLTSTRMGIEKKARHHYIVIEYGRPCTNLSTGY